MAAPPQETTSMNHVPELTVRMPLDAAAGPAKIDTT